MWIINAILIILGIFFAVVVISFAIPLLAVILFFFAYGIMGSLFGAMVAFVLSAIFSIAGAPEDVIIGTIIAGTIIGFFLGIFFAIIE